jgi:pimeloyl-ACP methyl ester carboxylesterase
MRSFAYDGLVFDVRDEGPEDGIPVMLLHGFPQDSTAWDAIVEPLHEHGYRTLAPNQRGYSPGARPNRVKRYRQADTVRDAVALLDAAEIEQAHIVGHDWGGFVAWGMAAAHPERVLTVTSLSTPHPSAMRSVALRSTQLFRIWYMALFQLPWLSEQILHPGGPAWQVVCSGLPKHQAQHYLERMQQPGALSAALNWYRAIPRELVHPSIAGRAITVPALLVWGERDPALSRSAAEATADFVDADFTFVILKGVGHWIPETAPDAVVEALLQRWTVE